MVIVQASENAALFLGTVGAVVGRALDGLGGNLAERIGGQRGQPLEGPPVAFRCRVGTAERECDVLLHRPTSGGLAIELEPAGPALDLSAPIQEALGPIFAAGSLSRLCSACARVFQELTGYDRVLVFRFEHDSHGEVVAERCKPGIESRLGQFFGGSEMPSKAHLMIERNPIRHLVDADEPPVAVHPVCSPMTGRALDLSRSTWRSLSPIHVELLDRMGVRGALVASLLVGGRLWGLILCHHRTPRFLHYPLRAACEVLAEAAATRIAALEASTQAEAERRARGLEARLVEAIARHGDWVPAILDEPEAFLGPLEATGVALACEGRLLRVGATPDDECLADILGWLDDQPSLGVIASSVSACRLPRLVEEACLLLAAPLSTGGGEYLIWFRAYPGCSVSTSTAGALPDLLASHPSSVLRMSARGSWSRAGGWSAVDRLTAGLISASVSDVVHQFRSVRVLIAQAQLAQVSAKMSLSDQPILIADPSGCVLMTTPAWERLPEMRQRPLARLQDLARRCAEPLLAEHQIGELLTRGAPWRGQISLAAEGEAVRQYAVRADPVLSHPGCSLGFVVILTDCTSQMDLRDAMRRIRDDVLTPAFRQRLADAPSELIDYGRLVSAVVGDVQRAAQQLTDAADPDLGAALIAGVETSVTRTLELLDRLIAYSGQPAGSGDRPA